LDHTGPIGCEYFQNTAIATENWSHPHSGRNRRMIP
jgi:hypothetical protein